jgi:hypothetical protein
MCTHPGPRGAGSERCAAPCCRPARADRRAVPDAAQMERWISLELYDVSEEFLEVRAAPSMRPCPMRPQVTLESELFRGYKERCVPLNLYYHALRLFPAVRMTAPESHCHAVSTDLPWPAHRSFPSR